MIKLTNIITEVLNTYQVEAFLLTDTKMNISDVLDQIRAIQKVTIVRNITPPEYVQKPTFDYTLVTIKFITRGDAREDLAKIKEDIETSDMSTTDLRVPGVKSIQFKEETLRRI